jgi:AcrR family transcriptional regulator
MAEVIAGKFQSQRMTAEDRRRQIVIVAADLFSQKGFSGTTTKEIADRAGVSEAIIFRHFATKRELYSAILDYKTQENTQGVQAQLEEAAQLRDDRSFFGIIAKGWLEFYRKDPSLLRLLLYSALEGHELSDIFFQSTTRDTRNYVRNYISQRMTEGAFRRGDPAVCARAFAGMVLYQAQVEHLYRSSDDIRTSPSEIAASFVDIFLGGLTERNGPAAGSS